MGKKKTTSTKPTTIFFLRHGEPENPQDLLKGVGAFPLSNKGQKQIEKQAQKFQDQKIAVIFTSPIRRCLQTAQIVARVLNQGLPRPKKATKNAKGVLTGPGGVKVKTTTYLTEWTSSLDGKPLKEAKSLPVKEYNRRFQPHQKVLKRMKYFLSLVLQKYAGQKVIAVSHQGPIDLLIFSLLGKNIYQLPGRGLVTKKGEIIKAVLTPEGKLISTDRIKPLT